MKSYDDFKASREKMDPSARKMNEHQWQQAYAAYKSTRERVHSPSSKGGSSKRSRSSSSRSSTTSGMHTPSSATPTSMLRKKVRAMSGYEEVRMLINLLAWIGIVVVVANLVAQCIFYNSTESWVMAAAFAAVRVLCILFFKAMAQVLIDIPDIALYRMHVVSTQMEQQSSEDASSESAD